MKTQLSGPWTKVREMLCEFLSSWTGMDPFRRSPLFFRPSSSSTVCEFILKEIRTLCARLSLSFSCYFSLLYGLLLLHLAYRKVLEREGISRTFSLPWTDCELWVSCQWFLLLLVLRSVEWAFSKRERNTFDETYWKQLSELLYSCWSQLRIWCLNSIQYNQTSKKQKGVWGNGWGEK